MEKINNTKSTSKIIIAVEGVSDEKLLRVIFDNFGFGSKYDMTFLAAQGKSGIISNIHTIMEHTNSDDKVIIAYDSDTTDPVLVSEELNMVKYIADYNYYKNRLLICPLVPNIENAILGIDDKMLGAGGDINYNVVRQNISHIRESEPIKEMINFLEPQSA